MPSFFSASFTPRVVSVAVAWTLVSFAVPNARGVTIDSVTVGNPGNGGQTQEYNIPGGVETLTFGAMPLQKRPQWRFPKPEPWIPLEREGQSTWASENGD